MIWLLCWADMIDRYAQMLGADARQARIAPGPSPTGTARATVQRACLQLVSVDGVLVNPVVSDA